MELAARYHYEFVDLKGIHLDLELFHSIQVDLMFRYNFVPIEGSNGTLEIALADPRNLSLIDELSVLLGKKKDIDAIGLTKPPANADEFMKMAKDLTKASAQKWALGVQTRRF